MRRIDPALATGAALTALFVLAALIAPLWTPYDVAAIDIAARLQGPSTRHWLGTDQFGRDEFSLVMAGASVSLGVAGSAIAAALALGVPLGLVASARAGWLDDTLMRTADVLFAFPGLLLAILLSAVLGPGAIDAALAIALFNVPVFARVARGAALPIWSADFIAAAQLAGRSRSAIALAHVLPNMAAPIIVQASIQAGLALLGEAGLSYAGLGVQTPAPSWGRMLADAQTLIGTAPRLAVVPGLAIIIAVAGFTLLGDGLARASRGKGKH
ncbi:peptide/opine/nickel uptake ABC transporter permease [Novosphingobium nitrogenifigens DSM 19370]|uniref:Peptide/opine/nickel uptake ABC transporter permease n=1 Tax=Novosphingobium nitrogenifigens DSM 19370 TaxID=983920 RepID=F1Z9N8_9SPHN|nr:ABC transporter permease [Novosphingobium nitrogenifigens]EGD58704.1 peptide/opine/nickel uptake ABC transporter permease [Novosphingobium nitrogenifigens DSM 19370]